MVIYEARGNHKPKPHKITPKHEEKNKTRKKSNKPSRFQKRTKMTTNGNEHISINILFKYKGIKCSPEKTGDWMDKRIRPIHMLPTRDSLEVRRQYSH